MASVSEAQRDAEGALQALIVADERAEVAEEAATMAALQTEAALTSARLVTVRNRGRNRM